MLVSQSPGRNHPMWRKLDRIRGHLSGSFTIFQHCQTRLLKSYQLLGDRVQRNDAMVILNGLLIFFIKIIQISYAQPLELT